MKPNSTPLSTICWMVLACWGLAGLGTVQGQDIFQPNAGTLNVSITAGDTRNYYDAGGPGGNYSSNSTSTVNACPATPGEAITLTFSHVDIETSSSGSGDFSGSSCCWDGLIISDDNGPLFAGCGEDSGDGGDACSNAQGENGPNDLEPGDSFTSTAADGCLTIFFESDGSFTETGWEATLSSSGTPTTTCSITNLVVDNLRCGDSFNSDDAYADVSFDVVGGSGDYLVIVQEAGTTDAFSGNFILGELTDGTINSSAQLTVGSVEGGDMAEVFVVDVADGSCSSAIVTVTVPVCPPCPAVGDLVITEIMQNPSAVFDEFGEWFEVYNAGTEQINMKNMVISDNGTNSHTIATDLLIDPGFYVVLGRNGDFGTNGGVFVNYVYGNDIQLANGDDEIILTCQGTEIDRVEYDGGPDFPNPTGASMQLDPMSFDATSNDNGDNWCEASDTYGDGDMGTPNDRNISCCNVAIDNIMATNVTCSGGSDGSIQITASGADSYSYTIDGPGGSQTNATGSFTGLMAGDYDITVADANNASCNDTDMATVGTNADNEDPAPTCPTDITVSNDPGECGAIVTFNIDVSDNCPGATVEAAPASGSFFEIGTTTVTVTATDASGRTATCTFDVTVNDTEDPVITCPMDVVAPNDPGLCSAVVEFDPPMATDNCGAMTIDGSITTLFNENNGFAGNMFDITNVSSQFVTIESFDVNIENRESNMHTLDVWYRNGTYVGGENSAAGWTLLGTATVTGQGEDNPTPLPVGGLTLAPGESYGIYIDLTSYNSGGFRYTNGSNTYNNGTLQLVTGIGKDDDGFTGTTFDPRIWNGTIYYAQTNLMINQTAGLPSGSVFPVGTTTNTFVAIDASGNTDECSFDVTVNDTEAPMITVCEGSTVNFNGEESFNSEDVINFDATDNCGVASVSYDPPIISCEDLGTTVAVTVTVTDIYGNPSTCVANVVVDGLPCGFMLSELGCNGDADYDVPTETFTLEATNCFYANPFNQDKITFVKAELCGNGEFIAEVSNLVSFGWAGIMMRETLDAGSKKISLARDNGFFARREVRTATNGPAYPQQFPAFGKNWLRLVRQGNQFIGYVSPNGVNWQQVMVANINMSECIYVGLFLTNKQFSTQTISADFNNVELNPANGGSLQQLPSNLNLAPTANVAVYPNPTAGPVTVDLNGMMDKEVQLELRNTSGQVLQQLDLGLVDDVRTELQLGDLPTGVYWLRIQATGEAPITERIVVQRP